MIEICFHITETITKLIYLVKKPPKHGIYSLFFTFLSDYIMILYYYKHVIENIVIN